MSSHPSNPQVSVVLPLHRAAEGQLEAALGCIRAQTLRPRQVVVVLNGADPRARRRAAALVEPLPGGHLIELPEANLAAALNAGFAAADAPLVARMDADDTCPPERLEIQAARLLAEPALAGVGCAYEVVDPEGRVLHTVRPPTDARRMRWSLLLANCLAHGSMMLRREAVLACTTSDGGMGFDPACRRAQDYELWLRLTRERGLAAVPEVLYRHRLRSGEDPTRSSPEQAAVAARAMMGAWAALPSAGGVWSGRSADRPHRLETAVAAGATAGVAPHEAVESLERILDEQGPTREGIMALLWARAMGPSAPRAAAEAARRALVREAGRALREAGASRVWLWGAGDHTRRVLEHASDLGVPVAGIVDDALAGEERLGFRVASPARVEPGEHVLISSDWHEEAIWRSSAPHRERGVWVSRLYAGAA